MGPRPVFRLRLGDRVAVKRIQKSGLVWFIFLPLRPIRCCIFVFDLFQDFMNFMA